MKQGGGLDLLPCFDCNDIPFFHMVLDLVILDQQQAVVDGVAEKDPGEGSGDPFSFQHKKALNVIISGGREGPHLRRSFDSC